MTLTRHLNSLSFQTSTLQKYADTYIGRFILPPCHEKTCGFVWGNAQESGLHFLLLSRIFWSFWLDYLSLQDHTFVLLFKAGFFRSLDVFEAHAHHESSGFFFW